MIYTSGSTGKPKGVMNTHRGICNRLLWMQDAYQLGQADRVMQKTPFSFDVSVWEFFWPLLTGACLVVARPEGHKDGAYLVELVVEQSVTTIHFVPSMLLVFVEERQVEACCSLKRVVCSGEALPFGLQERFFARLDAELHNLYGPTEAAVDVTFWPCGWESKEQVVPIGRPIANTQIRLLDAHLKPVPIGVPGELYIGGVGLACGYYDRSKLTAEKFVPDPFGVEGGARLYRSGDLARYLPDGNIEFLGRLDHQVKVRGFRIELGEIEAVLSQHPAVRQSVVVARGDVPGDKRLVAYVVPTQEPAPTIDQLRDFLLQRLPDYMVPAAFVLLDALPLLPNGKVNRQALPEPDVARPELAKAFVAPRTKLEEFLASLWRDILGIEKVGIHDDFFELGGDSIRGAIFINKVQDKLGEIVYVVVLFDAANIADFARYLSANYPQAVDRIFGAESLYGSAASQEGEQTERIDATKVAQIRQIIRSLPPRERGDGASAARNPLAIFVLSPPRSGSTLLRVMLGGHPLLFAPPELELLSFNTLEERKVALSGRYSFWLEGTVRAIMEIKGWGAEQVKSFVESCESEKWTTQQLYRFIQKGIGARRLVDKTSTYALDVETLKRAETDFDNALYIHLLRHPHAMIRSFEEAKLEQVFFRYPHSFSARELAELIWLVSHQNILAFLNDVPAGRQYRLRFEDLVRQPEAVLRGLCRFLGLEFHPAMLRPYEDQKKRMTDGLYAESRMLGDVKFHEHQRINPEVADRWREQYVDDFLGDATWQVAGSLGYERITASSLVPMQRGNSNKQPMFFVHPAGGNVFCYVDLVRHLGADQPFYGLQARGLDGDQVSFTQVEAMASHYVELIRTVQPEGHYLLGGWSMGGVVAFEMARQLKAQGQTASLLALIDSHAPGNTQEPAVDDHALLASFALDLGLPLHHLTFDLTNLEQASADERLACVLQQAKQAGVVPPDVELAQVRRLFDVFKCNVQAMRCYTPLAYAGPVILFKAQEPLSEKPLDEDLGWGALAAGDLTMLEVPGNHYTIMRTPNVEILARQLKHHLRIAETVREQEKLTA